MGSGNNWRIYEADNGKKYAVFRDAENASAGSLARLTTSDTFESTIPTGIVPRYVNLFRVAEGVRFSKKLEIGTRAVWTSITNGTLRTVTVGGNTWNISSYRAERGVRPSAEDTGLTEGASTGDEQP